VPGPESLIGYQYDGQGNRIGKRTIPITTSPATLPSTCDITQNGYMATNDYVLDQGGGQMTELAVDASGTATPQHSNVTANGVLIATYDAAGLHFYLNDPLGTRRAQTDAYGVLEQTCQSLPFGDALNCTQSAVAPTEHHFTGKERDSESGNDYFSARYYASTMGRFMAADPSGLDYADQSNPQSFNLYSYVRNNPLSFIDPSGLETAVYGDANCTIFTRDSMYTDDYGTTYVRNETSHYGTGCNQLQSDVNNAYIQHQSVDSFRIPAKAPNNNPCTNATLAAAGVTAQQQIATAQSYILNSEGPFGSVTAYAAAVHTGGAKRHQEPTGS